MSPRHQPIGLPQSRTSSSANSSRRLTDQFGDRQQDAAALALGDRVPPRSVVEGAPGGDDGEIDIGGAGPRHGVQHGTGGRIDRVERSAVGASTQPRR